MESALSITSTVTTAATLCCNVSKALSQPYLSKAVVSLTCSLSNRLVTRRRLCCALDSYSLPSQRSTTPLHFHFIHSSSLKRTRSLFRVDCASSSASPFSSVAGGGGNGVFGGGFGGGGGESGGESGSGSGDLKNSKVVAGASAADEVSGFSPDVLILDVGGMTCGGCAASVKRILESQPQVSSASVNLTTETAIIWPVSEAKMTPDWQQQLGQMLAKHLTSCGFKSSPRVAGLGANKEDISP